MDRRDFIKSGCISCAGAIGITWLMEACTSAKNVSTVVRKDNIIIIKKTEFTEIKEDKFITKKFIVVKPEGIDFPMVIYKVSDVSYKTHLLQCTHQGCELTPYETTMVCPCHGAEFNLSGEVTTGPAETNIKSFITTYDLENVYIQL